ncbi:MAG: hypothetical protein ACI4FZ_06265 [Lachnospiraceae bacterium]
MFWMILIVVIVLLVLFKMGVFRKTGACQCCGKTLKGTEQHVFGESTPFVLCKECADKIHPRVLEYAKKNWSYSDYTAYLAWEEATKEERAQFHPDAEYEYNLKVDTERGLFSFGSGKKAGLVFRFADLNEYELNFKPEEIKEGLLGDKVKGSEYITVDLATPRVYLEEVINYDVKLRLRKKGFFSSKYEYEFSDGFSEMIRAFSICSYIENARRNGGDNQEKTMNIGEVEKALALFMFDSMEDVTQDALKKQRNALIKAFHPDNAEANEAYSQKINAAYELLCGMLKK